MMPANVQRFDYSALNHDTRALARTTADKVRRHLQRTTAEIIEIGADLIRVKAALDHGQFGDWIAAELGWSDRTARNYMRAAEAFAAKSEAVSVLSPTAIYLLSAPSTPVPIRQGVISDLEHGRAIDMNAVGQRVAEARRMARKERKRKSLDIARQRTSKARREYQADEDARRQEGEAIARGLIEKYGVETVLAIMDATCDFYVSQALERARPEIQRGVSE